MSRIRAGQVLAAMGLVTALAGCGLTGAEPRGTGTSPVLATVNGQAITVADWHRTMNGLSLLQGAPIATTRADEKIQVNQLVVWTALEQWALHHHLITPARAAKAAKSLVSQYAASLGGTAALKKQLTTYHMSLGDFQQFMTTQEILEAAFTDVTKHVPKPSAAAIDQYYKANQSLFMQPASDELRLIVVKTKAEAQQLESELEHGASFAALAAKYSLDKTSAAKGGQIGTISQSSTSGAPSSLLQVMDPLKAGQYGIAPVGSDYYLFQVEKVNPAAPAPLSAVKAQIVSQLTATNDNTAFEQFGQKLKAKAHVVMHLP